MNLLGDEKRRAAARLIRSGTVVELGRRLEPAMPFFGTRRFDVHLKRTFMNPEPNRRGSNEEIVILEIGQVRSEKHTSELQSRQYLVCRLLLEKKKKKNSTT